MPSLIQSTLRNRLLLRLSAPSFDELRDQIEPIRLPRGFILWKANELISEVVFVEAGIASVIMTAPNGQEMEIGLFGSEGMGPVAAVLGSERTPSKVVMQIEGDGFRLAASALARAMDADRSTRLLLTRYAHTHSFQVACTALFNATAGVEERLARWLLMCRDRVDDDDMPLTHAFVSVMLAVRRASVTVALHALEERGLVSVKRGMIGIRDRPALELFAAGIYGQPEAEYRRLLDDAA